MERTGNDIRIGIFATPICALVGGIGLQLPMHFLKADINTWSGLFGLGAFYLIFGSFCALPTTVIGLPAVGAYVSSSYRKTVMTSSGFVLGGLTMMAWSTVFLEIQHYERLLRFGYGVRDVTAFMLVGSFCGAFTGLAMSAVSRQSSECVRP